MLQRFRAFQAMPVYVEESFTLIRTSQHNSFSACTMETVSTDRLERNVKNCFDMQLM